MNEPRKRGRPSITPEEKKRRKALRGLEENPEVWLSKQRMSLLLSIKESADRGNAQSQKLFAQLGGWLVEKQEVTVGLTADERARLLAQSKGELGEFRNQLGQGVD